MIATKQCSKCGETKPLDDFRKGRICRDCENKANRERDAKRRAEPKDPPAAQRECKHQEHKGPRLLPMSQFSNDKSKKDGLRSYCRTCTSTHHNQNQRQRSVYETMSIHISMRQNDDCYACHRMLKRKNYAVSTFYAGLIRMWAEYWRGEGNQPRASMAPEQIVTVVSYRSLSDEIDWLDQQPHRKAAQTQEEFQERCKDLRFVCGRCWSKWHVAAGVELVGLRKLPVVPDVVLTPREQAEWHEIEEELKQAEAEWDRIEQARNL